MTAHLRLLILGGAASAVLAACDRREAATTAPPAVAPSAQRWQGGSLSDGTKRENSLPAELSTLLEVHASRGPLGREHERTGSGVSDKFPLFLTLRLPTGK